MVLSHNVYNYSLSIYPDISSFRSCDSTFGVGSLSNDDDLGWFSISQAIEGSEDAIKSEFEFSCSDSKVVNRASETRGNSLPHGYALSHNDPKKKSATMCDNLSMQVNGSGETAALGHTSSMNGSDAQSESKEDSMSEKEVVKFYGFLLIINMTFIGEVTPYIYV